MIDTYLVPYLTIGVGYALTYRFILLNYFISRCKGRGERYEKIMYILMLNQMSPLKEMLDAGRNIITWPFQAVFAVVMLVIVNKKDAA
jgi:hypothetical protein